jgi:tight adherence protein C
MDQILITAITALIIAMIMTAAFSATLIFADYRENEKIEHRIERIVEHQNSTVINSGAERGAGTTLLFRLGKAVSRASIISKEGQQKIKIALDQSGLRDPSALPILIGIKISGMILGPLIFFGIAKALIHHSLVDTILVVATGFVLGMLGPEWALRIVRSKYQKGLSDGFPDALDLLIICIDAGLGLESALAKVAEEMRKSYPIIGKEFQITNHDIKLNPNVGVALSNMAERTGLPEIAHFGTTVMQSLIYGTPLSTSLAYLSHEMRAKALALFEEKASKLPTMMTLPMLLFIIPALVLIVMGPAIPDLMSAFHALTSFHA